MKEAGEFRLNHKLYAAPTTYSFRVRPHVPEQLKRCPLGTIWAHKTGVNPFVETIRFWHTCRSIDLTEADHHGPSSARTLAKIPCGGLQCIAGPGAVVRDGGPRRGKQLL